MIKILHLSQKLKLSKHCLLKHSNRSPPLFYQTPFLKFFQRKLIFKPVLHNFLQWKALVFQVNNENTSNSHHLGCLYRKYPYFFENLMFLHKNCIEILQNLPYTDNEFKEEKINKSFFLFKSNLPLVKPVTFLFIFIKLILIILFYFVHKI